MSEQDEDRAAAHRMNAEHSAGMAHRLTSPDPAGPGDGPPDPAGELHRIALWVQAHSDGPLPDGTVADVVIGLLQQQPAYDPAGSAMPYDPADVAETIAAGFHAVYESLAPEHGYRTRDASAVPWRDVPKPNRGLMTATVQALLERGVIRPPAKDEEVTTAAPADPRMDRFDRAHLISILANGGVPHQEWPVAFETARRLVEDSAR